MSHAMTGKIGCFIIVFATSCKIGMPTLGILKTLSGGIKNGARQGSF